MQTKSQRLWQRLWQRPCLFCRTAQVHGGDESVNPVKKPARYGRRDCLCLPPGVTQLDQGSCFALALDKRPLEAFSSIRTSFTAVLYGLGIVVAIRRVVPLVPLRLQVGSNGELENVAVAERTRILRKLLAPVAQFQLAMQLTCRLHSRSKLASWTVSSTVTW